MGKTLPLLILGLLAALGSAAPTGLDSLTSPSPYQEVFANPKIRGPSAHGAHNDGPVVQLPPSKSRTTADPNAAMQEAIANEMGFDYYLGMYGPAVVKSYPSPVGPDEVWAGSGIAIVSKPAIELAPARKISGEVRCTASTCDVDYTNSIGVSTTNSLEDSPAIGISGKIFGIGVTFTAPLGYGFSATTNETTHVSYKFDLVEGDAGYIALVNVQISATLSAFGCRCQNYKTEEECFRLRQDDPDQYYFWQTPGHHQAVIIQDDQPKGIISFISTR